MQVNPRDEKDLSHIEDLLAEESWLEKFQRIIKGLKTNPDSGEYKWARHEFSRIILPGLSSALSIIILVLCLALFLTFTEDKTDPEANVTMLDKKDVEKLPDDLPEPKKETEKNESDSVSDLAADTTFEPALDVAQIMENPVTETSTAPVPQTMLHLFKSPIAIPAPFGSRSGDKREKALEDGGGDDGTEDAVLKALRWLVRHQNQDGSWTMGTPAAAGTGLGLLCFLAHGETPKSLEFGATVEKSIKWLVANQKPDGNWEATGGHHSYGNAIANYAIAEAFAMTQIYSLKEVMDAGIKVIIDGQQQDGGWDYYYKDGGRTDLSVMAWQAQALKAASLAQSDAEGLHVAIYRCIPEFKRFQGSKGGFGYTSPGDKSLAAAGVLCLQLLSEAESVEVRKGLEYMYGWELKYDQPEIKNSLYHWYYATQAKFQAGGGAWDGWNDMMKPELKKAQATDGHWDAPGGGNGKGGGPVYTTTMACLMMEVYYRNLPTFKTENRVAESRAPETGARMMDDIHIEIR